MRALCFTAVLALVASLSAQTWANDAGTPAASPADAGMPDAGAPDAGAPVATPPSSTNLGRDIGEETLAAARQELERITALHIAFQGELEETRRELASVSQRHAAVALELRSRIERLNSESEADALYMRITTELEDIQPTALSLLVRVNFDSSSTALQPPKRLPREVTTLPSTYQPDIRRLEERRTAIAAVAAKLDQDRAALDRQRSSQWTAQALALSDLRLLALPRISDALKAEVYGVTARLPGELQVEAEHIAIHALDHLGTRRAQIGSAREALGTLQAAFRLALGSVELLLFIALVWWSMRRWRGWMLRFVSAMSRYVHLGEWPLLLARLADALQTCGPPLLLAAASFAVYYFVGGRSAPPEITITYIIIFWIALFRGQFRFVERLVENIAARRNELDTKAADDFGDAGPAPAPAPGPATELLVSRSWRVITWYLATTLVTLELAELATGPGVLHGELRTLFTWLLVPIGLLLVHWWRHAIVNSSQFSSDTGFSRFLRTHGDRRYGAIFALLAVPVVLATRGAQLVREHVANLDTTRRFLAFLFRRQVEQTGQVLPDRQNLPPELDELFPHGPLSPEETTLRPQCVDDLEALYEQWVDSPTDGSAILIGASGMGKSTTLNFLRTELEVEGSVSVDTKLTQPKSLVQHLRKSLDLPSEDSSEELLVKDIREKFGRQIICVDDCHNLFLRKVGGFDAWHALSRIVNESSVDVFWVLTINDVAWEYLLALDDGVSRFRRVFHLPGLSQEALLSLMTRRMRRAKYRLTFSDLLISELEGLKRSTQIIRTARGYFGLLWDYTAGNPRLANHFWLRSLLVDDDKNARVRLFTTPSMSDLEALTDEVAFALTAIVEHENVNASELAVITHLHRDRARFLLQLCRDRGFLYYDSATGRFSTSTHWQIAITRYLKRKNLLY